MSANLMDDQRFDAIVSGLYRAATGACSWNEALAGIQEAFGAVATVLHTYDLAAGRLLALNAPDLGNLRDALFDYTAEYGSIDPRKRHAMSPGRDGLDRWLHCHEVFDERFVARDPFYQHYLLPYGTRFNSNITIPLTASIGTAFVLELPASRGPLAADERALAQRLGTHLADALRAHERVRRMTAQALAGHGLLQGFAYPMWLIDSDRFVFYANPAAQDAVQTEAHVGLTNGRLALRNAAGDRQLTARLQALGPAAHGARAVVDARRLTTDPPTWLHLQTLVPGEVLGAFGELPVVLATLFDPARVHVLDPFALADMFGFTPAEARVAVQLAEGRTGQEIAVTLGCAISTVRTHIRSVLSKLGARRVVDAVRLLRQGEALWAAVQPGHANVQ